MLTLSDKSRTKIWIGLMVLVLIRIITMIIIPLTDTTEARYAEIARKMLETGNWITLLHNYTTPFWAKPPLSTWCSAFCMQIFGVNAFAARLPSLLIVLLTASSVYWWVTTLRNRSQALITLTVFMTSALILIMLGAVMTDPAMLLATTLGMICFWQALQTKNRFFGYGFFVALALGLLAKGPVAFVLTVFPIGLWLLYKRKILEAWRTLPVISGTLLMFAIALPWYLLAEQRTPGFLNYFIVGEHFSRFIESSWQGDMYGHAHHKPFGTIWAYWIIGAFPWSLFAIASIIKRKVSYQSLRDESGLISYLLLWSLAPLLFFSFSRNIILTYPLTGIPAFSILFVESWQRLGFNTSYFFLKDKVIFRGILPLLLVSVIYVALNYNSIPGINRRSQKLLAEYYLKDRPSEKSQLVYYIRQYYSAEFYSGGKPYTLSNVENIRPLLANNTLDYLAVPNGLFVMFPGDIRAHFEVCDKFGNIVLYKEKKIPLNNIAVN